MIITPDSSLCNDLLMVQLDNGIIDLSWAIDTDTLKTILESNDIEKILNFNSQIDFDIQIDNVDTFDSINLKTYKFSEIEQTYRGNIVYSAIIDFNKNKFEETSYYFRVKINNSSKDYNIFIQGQEGLSDISFEDKWTNAYEFTIRKNYTKDLIETMYNMVADFNAYNKEAKSANMYYIFQAFADTLNIEFDYIQDIHQNKMINKALPDELKETFGVLFKFTNVYGLSMEEYRRIIKNLIIAYQHGGAWDYMKNVLKYIIGYTPELYTLKNFYPWILRKATIVGYDGDQPIYDWNRPDPENYSDRTYYNADSNYYLFTENFDKLKNKDLVMLLNQYETLLTFIVKSDNFYNLHIDNDKIKEILNLLKSAYTKYSLNIKQYIEPSSFDNILLVDDDTYLLASDTLMLQY